MIICLVPVNFNFVKGNEWIHILFYTHASYEKKPTGIFTGKILVYENYTCIIFADDNSTGNIIVGEIYTGIKIADDDFSSKIIVGEIKPVRISSTRFSQVEFSSTKFVPVQLFSTKIEFVQISSTRI